MLFASHAKAAGCDSLSGNKNYKRSTFHTEQEIWKQLTESGRLYVISWSLSERNQLNVGQRKLISTWVESLIRHRLFQQLNLTDNQIYTFPIQGGYGSKSQFSINLKRTMETNGPVFFVLSHFKIIDSEDILKNLRELIKPSQEDRVNLTFGIQTPRALSVYRGITLSSLEFQLNILFKNPKILDELNKLAPDSEITLERPEYSETGRVTHHARRFIFAKDKNNVINLIAYEI